MTKGIFMKGENMAHHKSTFDKRFYIKAAEDLHYPDSVICKIRASKTERESAKK